MIDVEVSPIMPGLAPTLEIAVNSTVAESVNRADGSSSFSVERTVAESTMADSLITDSLGTDAFIEMRAPTIDVIESIARAEDRPADVTPPGTMLCSVFVQLDRDLDPQRRHDAKEQVMQTCSRVRWKRENAVAEVDQQKVDTLRHIPGVAYVDSGESITSPEPVVGQPISRIDTNVRAIDTGAEQHKHGEDVLIGIIDVEGFDFAHEDFLDEEGNSRWVAIWDQGGDSTRRPPPPTPPTPVDGTDDKEPLQYGSEITDVHIARAIHGSHDPRFRMPATMLEPQSQMYESSHGTHVASIAAGNSGVARRAEIAGVLVKIDDSKDVDGDRRVTDRDVALTSFYDSTRIADAVEYLLDLARRRGKDGVPMPISINISLGTNGHAHDGSSPMARWVDDALSTRGRCVTVSAGNAGQTEPAPDQGTRPVAGRIHASGTFAATNLRHELGWVVGADGAKDFSDNKMEIWYRPQDRITVEVRPPASEWIMPIVPGTKTEKHLLDNGTRISIFSEVYHPANGLNRISIILSPDRGALLDDTADDRPIAAGQWRVRLTANVVRDGRYDAWIERDDPSTDGNGQRSVPSFFAKGSYTDDRMINSLACAGRIISVANVAPETNSAHPTSSRGPTRDGRDKPDIAADGTSVVAANALGGRQERWTTKTGTSMAAPYVCGVAALMLAVSPRLMSTQIQAMMITASTPLVGHTYAWRSDTGFGLIDGAASISAAMEYERSIQMAQGAG